MSIIIDLIIVAILGICIFFGYKNGLTKSIIKILSFIIAVVVAVIFFKPIGNYVINNTKIDDNIRQAIINLVSKDVEENGEVSKESDLPKSMVNYINDTVKNAAHETKETIVGVAADNISRTAVYVGTAIALFLVTRIILMIISALSNILTDLPVIKQFDKTGGVIYGLLKALIIIYILLAIISLISPAIEQTGLIKAINKSYIGSFLYDNNILVNLVL